MTATMQKYAIEKGLPKNTSSICPVCGKILEATLFQKDGKVYMKRNATTMGNSVISIGQILRCILKLKNTLTTE